MNTSLNKDEDNREEKDNLYLLNYVKHLEKRIRNLESERQLLEAERLRLEQEIHGIRNEIDHLREPPLITGTVIDVLDPHKNRVIIRSSSGPSFIVSTSKKVKDSIESGMEVALNQHTYSIMEILPMNYDPFIRGMEVIDNIPDISYADVGGLEEQIQEVREMVELPLKKPELFLKVGIEPPKGILFHGPPGTGKTLLAKAVAHETDVAFIRVIGSELVQKYIGEGARFVREIFNLAREKAPAILLIDELDAIGATRLTDSTSGDREVQRTLMQLLSELDGFSERGDIKFIGATNRIDILDTALLRSGRFDRIIEFPMPNEIARTQIFKIHTRNLNLDKSVNLKHLVNITKDASGADIKAICTEAGMFAIRRNSEIIIQSDFLQSIDKTINKRQCRITPTELFV
ncbi:MAG: proteasome-activating nucleotidase [Candidatus Lokiarchaeota archaeon]|nr:proteasome-activating nucleotidase [Candidatus Lokiarchaeota archaeon]